MEVKLWKEIVDETISWGRNLEKDCWLIEENEEVSKLWQNGISYNSHPHLTKITKSIFFFFFSQTKYHVLTLSEKGNGDSLPIRLLK